MTLTVKTSKKTKGVYVIAPTGSINSDTYGVLEKETQRMVKKSPQQIILDMAGVGYLSSMGVRVILATMKALQNNGGKLVLVNLQPQIKKVLDIVNALPSLRIFENLAELDQYLDVMQRKAVTGEDESA